MTPPTYPDGKPILGWHIDAFERDLPPGTHLEYDGSPLPTHTADLVEPDADFTIIGIMPPAPPPPGVGGTRTYRMSPNPFGPSAVVVYDEAGGTTTARFLPHHQRHSPDGFSWGYEGSGPAELARCLLIDVLGEGGHCAGCEGTGTVIYRDQDGFRSVPRSWKAGEPCPTCGGSGFSSVIEKRYQRFKREVVALHPMNEPWALSADEVRAWLANYTEEAPQP